MPERRPGVPRLRHGVGVGVGHACTEGTVHGAISDDGDPFTGLFIAASCNSRSSHGQVVQYVTVTVYDYWDRIVGTSLQGSSLRLLDTFSSKHTMFTPRT